MGILGVTILDMTNPFSKPQLKSVHTAINGFESAMRRLSGIVPVQQAIDDCRSHSGVGVHFGRENVLVDIFGPFFRMIFGKDKIDLESRREQLNEVGPHTLDQQLEETRVRRNSGFGFGLAHKYVSCVVEAAECLGFEHQGMLPLDLAESAKSLNRQSSSGYPYFQSQSVLIDGGKLVADAAAAFSSPASILRLPTTLWTRAQIRESGPKQRFVWGFPAVVKVLEQCFAFPIAESMRKSDHYCSGLQMSDYGVRIESLRSKSVMTVTLDFSAFDQTIRAEHAYAFFAFIQTYFRLSHHWLSVLRVLCAYSLSNVLVARKGVVTGIGGLPSGSQFTSVEGSFINVFLMLRVLRDLDIRSCLTGFLVCGDDLMIGFDSDCVEIRDLVLAYEKVGLRVDLVKSSKVFTSEDKPINFLGFLWAFGFNFPLSPILPIIQCCFPASRVDYHGLERRLDRVLTICGTTAAGWLLELALVGTELFSDELLSGKHRHLTYDFKDVVETDTSRIEVVSSHIDFGVLVDFVARDAHLRVQWWDSESATLTLLVAALPPHLRPKVVQAHESAFPRLSKIGRGVGYFD